VPRITPFYNYICEDINFYTYVINILKNIIFYETTFFNKATQTQKYIEYCKLQLMENKQDIKSKEIKNSHENIINLLTH